MIGRAISFREILEYCVLLKSHTLEWNEHDMRSIVSWMISQQLDSHYTIIHFKTATDPATIWIFKSTEASSNRKCSFPFRQMPKQSMWRNLGVVRSNEVNNNVKRHFGKQQQERSNWIRNFFSFLRHCLQHFIRGLSIFKVDIISYFFAGDVYMSTQRSRKESSALFMK